MVSLQLHLLFGGCVGTSVLCLAGRIDSPGGDDSLVVLREGFKVNACLYVRLVFKCISSLISGAARARIDHHFQFFPMCVHIGSSHLYISSLISGAARGRVYFSTQFSRMHELFDFVRSSRGQSVFFHAVFIRA